MKFNVIITGVTGMVGEGVLLECLEHPAVEKILIVNRKSYPLSHPKVKELIVPNFMDLTKVREQLKGYDACFFCAGVSSVGMKEPEYTRLTYDLTLSFARTLADINPNMIFDYVSGSHTDSSEKGKVMWARVKGKTENALMKLPFKRAYNFRPGFMKITPGQKSIKGFYRVISAFSPFLSLFFSKQMLTLREVATAMINTVLKGYDRQVLEIADIRKLTKN